MTSLDGGDRRPTARRRSSTLADAARIFLARPTPWLLAASGVAAGVARVTLGGWGRDDALVLAGLVLLFPLLEWCIHVVMLHWRPRQVAGFTIDPLVARKHREHHADPRDADLVFIPLPTLVKAVAGTAIVGLVGFPSLGTGIGPGVTFIASQALLGTVYEWTHYLVHTDYRPRTRFYRAIWRNHRLHHYKNERYWFTVTTEGTADRLLGTCPDPADVETSPTARALHADALPPAAAARGRHGV